ncbi:hypothetical protein VSK91_01870 [Bacillus swezeyi]|uniref:hypothetical protein n=1 Tax=Bacillus swezeyi TaxID=1925020 RepID=UPI0039C5F8A0
MYKFFKNTVVLFMSFALIFSSASLFHPNSVSAKTVSTDNVLGDTNLSQVKEIDQDEFKKEVGIDQSEIAKQNNLLKENNQVDKQVALQLDFSDQSPIYINVVTAGDEVISTSYQDNKKLDVTIANNKTGKVTTYDIKGNKEQFKLNDFIDKSKGSEVPEETVNKNEDDDQSDANNNVFSFISNFLGFSKVAKASGPPKGYKYITKSYNRGVKLTGYLYGKNSTTYGKTIHWKFSKGTKITTIVTAAVAGGWFLITSPKTVIGLVRAVLGSLGASMAGNILTSGIDGYVKSKKVTTTLRVYAKGKLGLVSKKYKYYYKTGKKYKYGGKGGDRRSNKDLCQIGAYNVYLEIH